MRFYIIFIFLTFFHLPLKAIDTKASYAILLDHQTKEVIFEKNADQKIDPASMTKIMTVYVIFDHIINSNLSLDDICTVSPQAYRMGGSRMFLEINDQVTINDLLRGIIIQSGNDASVAIAECISGTENAFSDLMNVYGEKLNLINTNFLNSSGWPQENHYSTVRDIAVLSRAIINDFPELYSFFKEKEFTYNDIKQLNRNKLIIDLPGTDGLKTGFTKKSGWGISASTIKGDRRVIVVVSGTNSSRSRILESKNLINWSFRETKQQKLLEKGQIIKNVDVWLGSKPTINLIIKDDIITTLSYEQLKTLKSNIEYQKPISAPINKGQKLGNMLIEISGKQDINVPLVAEKNINKINPIFRIFAAFKYLIFGTSLDE